MGVQFIHSLFNSGLRRRELLGSTFKSAIVEFPDFEYAVAHGDTDLYLVYDSANKFIETILLEKKNCEVYKYPLYSEHYVDDGALKEVRPKLNTNMYHHTQMGNKSKRCVVNVYEIRSFTLAWSEAV